MTIMSTSAMLGLVDAAMTVAPWATVYLSRWATTRPSSVGDRSSMSSMASARRVVRSSAKSMTCDWMRRASDAETLREAWTAAGALGSAAAASV